MNVYLLRKVPSKPVQPLQRLAVTKIQTVFFLYEYLYLLSFAFSEKLFTSNCKHINCLYWFTYKLLVVEFRYKRSPNNIPNLSATQRQLKFTRLRSDLETNFELNENQSRCTNKYTYTGYWPNVLLTVPVTTSHPLCILSPHPALPALGWIYCVIGWTETG